MQTDYTATYYRDDSTLEVSDGHDNVVTTVRCEEWQIADRMRDEFGHLALYIPVELRDDENMADDELPYVGQHDAALEHVHDTGYYPEN